MFQSMFQYLITVEPLGFMYGSAGAFLSPENLVGRSGAKFPPDAAVLSGLFFSLNTESSAHEELKHQLYVAGPFWAEREDPGDFYVPIPRYRIFDQDDYDEWQIENYQWRRSKAKEDEGAEQAKESEEVEEIEEIEEVEAFYTWQKLHAWERSSGAMYHNEDMAKPPWQATSFLHPKTKPDERHVVKEDGLFLENAIQMEEGYCLVYLSTHKVPDGWYRFGGEGHLVEITSQPLEPGSCINQLLTQPIQRSFALITPGVWGSNSLSYRYPQHPDFPKSGIKLLTERPDPYRYRIGHQERDKKAWDRRMGRLSRGRYAVPAGSVYVLKQPLEKTWWQLEDCDQETPHVSAKPRQPRWFPKEGFSLKHLGCGLCLPIQIKGVDDVQARIGCD